VTALRPYEALRSRDLVVPTIFTTFLVGEVLLTPVPGSRPLALLFAVLMGATFLPRKRLPLTMLAAAAAVNVIRQVLDAAPEGSYGYSIALPVLFFGVAAYGDRTRRVPPLLVAVLVPAAYVAILPELRGSADYATMVSLSLYSAGLAGAGAALGITLRDRRDYARRLGGRVDDLERALDGSHATSTAWWRTSCSACRGRSTRPTPP
jgi:hypothetical protein